MCVHFLNDNFKFMKTTLCLWGIILILVCCKSRERLVEQKFDFTSRPVNTGVKEEVRDSLQGTAWPVKMVKQETVTLTQGCQPLHYCVIVGSFAYPQNAVRLRNQLMQEGFQEASIYRNAAGMFRVSILCDDSYESAWQEVCHIRSEYPQYYDAWLLETNY